MKRATCSCAALEFAELESWLASHYALRLSLHRIESEQQARGREIQRLLLETHLQQRGDGDVGPTLHVARPGGELLYTHRRLGSRTLTTLFGPVHLLRMGYSRPGCPAFIRSIRPWPCLPGRSPTSSSGIWSRPQFSTLSTNRSPVLPILPS